MNLSSVGFWGDKSCAKWKSSHLCNTHWKQVVQTQGHIDFQLFYIPNSLSFPPSVAERCIPAQREREKEREKACLSETAEGQWSRNRKSSAFSSSCNFSAATGGSDLDILGGPAITKTVSIRMMDFLINTAGRSLHTVSTCHVFLNEPRPLFFTFGESVGCAHFPPPH